MSGDNFRKGDDAALGREDGFPDDSEKLVWLGLLHRLKRNHSIIILENGSATESVGASKLEEALAEAEGAQALLFAGKVNHRVVELASTGGIKLVIGHQVSLSAKRDYGGQAYSSEDFSKTNPEVFQKGNQKRGSGLGLAAAISKSRQNHKKAAEKRAVELFKEMKVIDEVIGAIDKGDARVVIEFPAAIRKKKSGSQYIGEVLWSDVIQSLSALIRDEVNSITIEEWETGGCCGPAEFDEDSPSICYNCRQKRKSNYKAFDYIVLTF